MGRLLAVSDVHGHRDDLERGLDRAGFGGADDLWVLGDLLDRGPDGIGTIDHVRDLQRQLPGQVHVLMGNHEALALGMRRFPDSPRFRDSWQVNGGRRTDQDGLDEERVAWLASLPLLGRADDFLLMHSDTVEYLAWGSSVEEVNDAVRAQLADPGDHDAHWDLWARLTSRYDFAGRDGAAVARRVLETYGGEMVVHGHSIIGTLVDVPSEQVDQPLRYADGLVLDIDGGRYDGGPLLIVELS